MDIIKKGDRMSQKTKKLNKEKWDELLANKAPETHAKVMRRLGITPEEDKKWHQEHGGEPADFSHLKKD